MAELTIEWAILNEADPAACVGFFADKALPVAGPGAPLVSEFALMEYAAALGVTTESGFAQVGGILELRYRLPELWGTGAGRAVVVVAGPPGRRPHHQPPRSGCRLCRPAPRTGGAFVFLGAARPHRRSSDGAVRPRGRRSQTAGGGGEATRRCPCRRCLLRRHRPDRRRGRPRRCPRSRRRPPAGAKQQADLGHKESLDVRRAKALGDLARRQLAFGFEGAEPGRASGPGRPHLRGRADRHRDRRPVWQHPVPDQRGADPGMVRNPHTT